MTRPDRLGCLKPRNHKRPSSAQIPKGFRGLRCGHSELIGFGVLEHRRSRGLELEISRSRLSAPRASRDNPLRHCGSSLYSALNLRSELKTRTQDQSLSPEIEQLIVRRNQQLGLLIRDVALITARARTIQTVRLILLSL